MSRSGLSRVADQLLAAALIGVAGCTTVPTRQSVADRTPARVPAPAARPELARSVAGAGKSVPNRPPAATIARKPLESAESADRIRLVRSDDASEAPDIVAAEDETPPSPGPAAALDLDSTPHADYTFSLSEVLSLADAQNPNVALARERINEAYARVERAEVMWLPSLRAGLNYNHHEGAIQDVAGKVFETNRSAFYGGMGANGYGAASPTVPGLVAQFHLTDAIFQPKIAGHQASSRQFGATAARNDTLRDAAVAYLELMRAEHGVAIAREARDNTQKLATLTREYAQTGQGLRADERRMEAELAARQDQLITQQEAVKVASARLAQLLHADPSALITSGEPTVAALDVLSADQTPADFVATGLSRRPELAEQKHLVCEAVERLRREKFAPLVPSVLLGMSYGGMGGGLGSSIVNTSDRWDADAVAFWEVRNLGFGERAARNESSSVVRQAQMRELALLDRVAREVTESHTQVTQRQQRIEIAQRGIVAAEQSYTLNQDRIQNGQGLPIEVLQAIQALATARRNYLDAVVDYNVAQFELCRAIGWFVEA